MQHINLLSLVQAYQTLKPEVYDLYAQHHGIKIKEAEFRDLNELSDMLYSNTTDLGVFNEFYVSYKIPQIGKEFDLLRVGSNYIINIEIKQISSHDKILKQLLRNRYYLYCTGAIVYNFSFVSERGELYVLKDDDTLEIIGIEFLLRLLTDQKLDVRGHIDNLFNPSDYLVSPFNSTRKFLESKYFLTHQQEEIKCRIIGSLISKCCYNFISIIGGAGTGKTLLAYDIAKTLIKAGEKVLIVHCGSLNEGQETLRDNGWEIIPIKVVLSYDLSAYSVVIIDEAQRIKPEQLQFAVSAMLKSNGSCIFSYDKLQTLARWEEKRNIDFLINSIENISTFRLSEKIRTNKEVANFIRMLFNNKRSLDFINQGNILLSYFENNCDARLYIESLDSAEWEVIRFTPSQYQKEHHSTYSSIMHKTSHSVIGQEFDNVVVIIDRYFTYDENGSLSYRGGAYYYPLKMLFQNITRARKKVNIVIINNEELLIRCLSILR
ncbi:DNA/RNA helicase domain-containing protein [Cronobacter turicensis]